MKREKRDLLRVQSLIENDRINCSDNFNELVTKDVGAVLKDYFEFTDHPTLKIEKYGDRYVVNMSVLISRIRTFEYLPKD